MLIAFLVQGVLTAALVFGLPMVLPLLDFEGQNGMLVCIPVWFLGGLLVGMISPGRTFIEPAVASLIVAIPTTFLLIQSQTVRTMPLFLYLIFAAIGILLTLIGAYIGERIQLGPPPKTAEWDAARRPRHRRRGGRRARSARRAWRHEGASVVVPRARAASRASTSASRSCPTAWASSRRSACSTTVRAAIPGQAWRSVRRWADESACVRYAFAEAFQARWSYAFQVPRDEFDALLFRHAGACGAEMREGLVRSRSSCARPGARSASGPAIRRARCTRSTPASWSTRQGATR